MDARGPVGALRRLECGPDRGVELAATDLGRCQFPVHPLVEPGDADPQDRAAHHVWHPVHGPLVGDEACHAHFVASFTHYAEHGIMPSVVLNSLWGKGFPRAYSA